MSGDIHIDPFKLMLDTRRNKHKGKQIIQEESDDEGGPMATRCVP